MYQKHPHMVVYLLYHYAANGHNYRDVHTMLQKNRKKEIESKNKKREKGKKLIHKLKTYLLLTQNIANIINLPLFFAKTEIIKIGLAKQK